MQTLSYTIGNWYAEAQLEELESGKLMAIISVTGDRGSVRNSSKHTVVFQHEPGKDAKQETEMLVRHLLQDRYSV